MSRPQRSETNPMRVRVLGSWQRGFLALNELIVHSLVTLAVVASIEVVEVVIKRMTGGQDLVFFRGADYFEFPARWLFDAADIGLLIALLVRGIIVIHRVYKGG